MSAPVIVGVDGGEASEDALRLGQWTAQTLDAPLIVAVVHPAPSALGSGRVDAEWVADRHRAATAVLDGARTVLAGATGDIAYRVVASTSAAHGLHDLAEELSAEVIVVGSGRAGSRHRLFAGSTAERLLAGSVCPVAVAPAAMETPPGALGRVGVAYVDTPDGRAALAAAARLAARTGSPLRLYTVVADADATMPFLVGQDAEHAFLETARETYELALSRAAESAAGVETDWEIRVGDVVESLADLDDVDVLFCGSRGYGPARRVLLGGVSARLVRRARRPVVIVPRSAAGQT
ncbi:universal stress protein [Amorphoplanes digitatis]|uniref:Nucleotide-binding universal stress UspA family protein n=1 Tax=Actinoplanes digitatis TaxID=1868 RepID=A0A7W7MQB4_9ACTN|nr:universal stress protein [Actinoplanes digitatis]MBB4762547.1 nucleotide-binding universal stress UspA family protein [Actinoplanes digitatis]GID92326.1 universal stress protein [Actinoplanes digitatis]